MARAHRPRMRHASAATLASIAFGLVGLFAPAAATAGPVTAGVNLGLAQSKIDGESGADASHTLGLFGRLGFTPRVAGQLELARIQTDEYSSVDIRSATALLVVELGARGRLVPILVAGIGLASASNSYGGSTEAHHIEGGLGLEYRAEGGLTIGADARLGGRTLHQDQDIAYPATGCIDCRVTGIALYAPSNLQEGEYRSARITVGIRF
ncbi:MAG: hypothetical protein JWP01_4074 [Myxococcales bacterium]|nr:hypothetical protein [Myxococcales bacterium]